MSVKTIDRGSRKCVGFGLLQKTCPTMYIISESNQFEHNDFGYSQWVEIDF